MNHKTALFILQKLAELEMISVKHSTFHVDKYPQPVDMMDIKDAFAALIAKLGFDRKSFLMTTGYGIDVWTKERLFEKLFKLIFIDTRTFPADRTNQVEGDMSRPLPHLFVGVEKTQIRQIPLVDNPPWPFKLLLELGAMIVVRPHNRRDMLLELKQFVNNHPQFRLRIDAKEWPDGSIVLFTWWFEKLPKPERKKNLNVA